MRFYIIFEGDYRFNLKILCDRFIKSKTQLGNILQLTSDIISIVESYNKYNVDYELTNLKYKNHRRFLAIKNNCHIILELGIESYFIIEGNKWYWRQTIEDIPEPGNIEFYDNTKDILSNIRRRNTINNIRNNRRNNRSDSLNWRM